MNTLLFIILILLLIVNVTSFIRVPRIFITNRIYNSLDNINININNNNQILLKYSQNDDDVIHYQKNINYEILKPKMDDEEEDDEEEKPAQSEPIVIEDDPMSIFKEGIKFPTNVNGSDVRVGIIMARWNGDVIQGLYKGVNESLTASVIIF